MAGVRNHGSVKGSRKNSFPLLKGSPWILTRWWTIHAQRHCRCPHQKRGFSSAKIELPGAISWDAVHLSADTIGGQVHPLDNPQSATGSWFVGPTIQHPFCQRASMKMRCFNLLVHAKQHCSRVSNLEMECTLCDRPFASCVSWLIRVHQSISKLKKSIPNQTQLLLPNLPKYPATNSTNSKLNKTTCGHQLTQVPKPQTPLNKLADKDHVTEIETSSAAAARGSPCRKPLQDALNVPINEEPFGISSNLLSLAEWMAQTKYPNFIFTTKMVFPKSLKFMNSGSQCCNLLENAPT